MQKQHLHKLITGCIALVWLANGLVCKVLNYVPRHQQIVSRILGNEHSRALTILIGLSEMVMAAWILSGFKPRLNALTQMAVIATMNAIEFTLAPDLLLWGKFNAMFALLFILLICYNEFKLNTKTAPR